MFRDTYLKNSEHGSVDICEYYHTAPIIVEKINKSPNAVEIFHQIYNDLVIPCVTLIDNGCNEEAYHKYKDYVKALQAQYC